MLEGENIDVSQHAGTHPENTPAWSGWALRHMDGMRVLGAAGLVGIHNKEWRNVAEHSLVVNAAANLIARELAQAGAEVDLDVVDKASLLHDVSKRFDKDADFRKAHPGHPSRTREILAEAGYPSDVASAAECAGRTITMFASQSTQRSVIAASSLEELVVAYADARVRNTDIVSLEDARKLNKLKVPADEAIYDRWYEYYKNVEAEIIRRAGDGGFAPENVNDAAVTSMVIRETGAGQP